MVKKLTKKSELANIAGVSAAAITNACKRTLKPAVDGNMVDLNHPLVVEYIEKRTSIKTISVAPGIDPLYNDAIIVCEEAGKWNANILRKDLNVGAARSKKIFEQIKAAGIIPDKNNPIPKESLSETPEFTSEPVKVPHIRGTAAAKETKKRSDPFDDEDPIKIPENIEIYADMTLRKIIDEFGTESRFVDFLSALQKIEIINEKRIKNAEAKGELISRLLVKNGLLDPIDEAHIKLLTDGARTITQKLFAMVNSNEPIEECEKVAVDQISSFIKPLKAKIQRSLKSVSN